MTDHSFTLPDAVVLVGTGIVLYGCYLIGLPYLLIGLGLVLIAGGLAGDRIRAEKEGKK